MHALSPQRRGEPQVCCLLSILSHLPELLAIIPPGVPLNYLLRCQPRLGAASRCHTQLLAFQNTGRINEQCLAVCKGLAGAKWGQGRKEVIDVQGCSSSSPRVQQQRGPPERDLCGSGAGYLPRYKIPQGARAGLLLVNGSRRPTPVLCPKARAQAIPPLTGSIK